VTDEAADEDKEEEVGPEDEQPMTFWQHLEELRKRLLWSIGFLFVGFFVA